MCPMCKDDGGKTESTASAKQSSKQALDPMPPCEAIGQPRPSRNFFRLHSPSAIEQWTRDRFVDTSPDLFCADGIAIYSTHLIEETFIPSQVRSVWHSVSKQHQMGDLSAAEQENLSEVGAVLIVTDIHNDKHLEDTLRIIESINSLGVNSPPIIIVPHCMSDSVNAEQEDATLLKLLKAGADDVIVGEPQGIRFACEVCSRIMQEDRLADSFDKKCQTNLAQVEHMQKLEDNINSIVWDYMNVRLKTGIPRVDYSLGSGIPSSIDDLTVGDKLGAGSYGMVCKLVDHENKASGQVLKIMKKDRLPSFHGIAAFKREIAVMEALSTDALRHVNIVEFYEVFQSVTHVFFRMEDGGSVDLCKRLKHREANRPLGVNKASSIMSQCMAGLCHLHMQANVAHRDIKPENIIIDEKADGGIVAKLTDFDLARFMKPRQTRCVALIGTFPFMAPELAFESKYDSFAADVWSMGVVFLEILCKLNILTKTLRLRSLEGLHGDARTELEIEHLKKIHEFFAVPARLSKLLQKFTRRELQALQECSEVLLAGMLNTTADQRWEAIDIQNYAEKFQ